MTASETCYISSGVRAMDLAVSLRSLKKFCVSADEVKRVVKPAQMSLFTFVLSR